MALPYEAPYVPGVAKPKRSTKNFLTFLQGLIPPTPLSTPLSNAAPAVAPPGLAFPPIGASVPAPVALPSPVAASPEMPLPSPPDINAVYNQSYQTFAPPDRSGDIASLWQKIQAAQQPPPLKLDPLVAILLALAAPKGSGLRGLAAIGKGAREAREAQGQQYQQQQLQAEPLLGQIQQLTRSQEEGRQSAQSAAERSVQQAQTQYSSAVQKTLDRQAREAAAAQAAQAKQASELAGTLTKAVTDFNRLKDQDVSQGQLLPHVTYLKSLADRMEATGHPLAGFAREQALGAETKMAQAPLESVAVQSLKTGIEGKQAQTEFTLQRIADARQLTPARLKSLAASTRLNNALANALPAKEQRAQQALSLDLRRVVVAETALAKNTAYQNFEMALARKRVTREVVNAAAAQIGQVQDDIRSYKASIGTNIDRLNGKGSMMMGTLDEAGKERLGQVTQAMILSHNNLVEKANYLIEHSDNPAVHALPPETPFPLLVLPPPPPNAEGTPTSTLQPFKTAPPNWGQTGQKKKGNVSKRLLK